MIYIYAGGGWTIISAVWAGRPADALAMPQFIMAGVGFAIWLLGAVVIVFSARRQRGKKTLTLKILEHGLVADGVITAVNRDGQAPAKGKPAYAVVEFTFLDLAGDQHAGRDDRVDAALAARLQLQAGGKVQLMYLKGNPEQNILLLD
jgi:hypothetical protein